MTSDFLILSYDFMGAYYVKMETPSCKLFQNVYECRRHKKEIIMLLTFTL
jgi:hypothetical protein